VGTREDLSAEQDTSLGLFEEGLANYRERRWDRAENSLRQVLEITPDDGPSRAFLERIEAFRQTPPGDDWSGVWVAESKGG